MENGLRSTDRGCGQWYFAVQIQFEVPNEMGGTKWAVEFRKQLATAV